MSELSTRDVCSRAQDALAASPLYALRDCRVEHEDGTLLISGIVSSFYHKQLAQEVVRAVAGKIEVVNSIQVRQSD